MPLDAIRIATDADAALVADLLRRAFADQAEQLGVTAEEHPRHPAFRTPELVAAEMADGFAFFVLDADGRPAGCVAIGTDAQHGGDGYLARLGVLPECRGRGFGELLVGFAEAALRDRGARRVRLGVLRPLAPLQQWYRRQGYVPVAADDPDAGLAHVVFMDKPLTD